MWLYIFASIAANFDYTLWGLLDHVRDDAGHSSSSITDKYIDIELHERHSSAKRKRIKPAFIEEN